VENVWLDGKFMCLRRHLLGWRLKAEGKFDSFWGLLVRLLRNWVVVGGEMKKTARTFMIYESFCLFSIDFSSFTPENMFDFPCKSKTAVINSLTSLN
jgi:hypothetical protein